MSARSPRTSAVKRKIIFGQDAVIDQSGSASRRRHNAPRGAPGTANLMVKPSRGHRRWLQSHSIYARPDALDITGTNVFNVATSQFTLRHGPVFTDVLLADEINRTPPKTQAALRGDGGTAGDD